MRKKRLTPDPVIAGSGSTDLNTLFPRNCLGIEETNAPTVRSRGVTVPFPDAKNPIPGKMPLRTT